MKINPISLAFFLFLISLAAGLNRNSNNNNPKCDIKDQGSTLQVFHVNSPCSPFRPKSKPMSWEEDVLQMQAKDEARLQHLSSLVDKKSVLPITYGRQIVQSPTYIVRAKIGTPPQTLLMAMDTSSDVAWIPCTGCVGCPSSTVFDSRKSTTFKPVACGSAQCNQVLNASCGGTACGFNLTYAGSFIAATISQDTITLATDHIPGYTFGCIKKATGSSLPAQGLLGLSRAPLSLLSQAGSLYQSTFSYCLPNFKSPNSSGSLILGPTAQPLKMQYTPMFKSYKRSSLYFVNLNAIRVASKIVDIPTSAFDFNDTTGSGTIFDSGTVFTRLVRPAYTAVRDEFRKRVGNATVTSLGGFDTCYTVPIVAPTVTFMFAALKLTLPPENLLIHSTAGSTTCLAMAASPDNVNSIVNVIASMQQQNHRIVYDLLNEGIGVVREQCS